MSKNVIKFKPYVFIQSLIYALFFYAFYESSLLCNTKEIIPSISLCFIANISLMLLSHNNVLRTKLYLMLGALASGLLYSLEYKIFSNPELTQIILIVCFCTFLAIGPFRSLKSYEMEKKHEIISIISAYFFLIGFRCQITLPEAYMIMAFIVLLFNLLLAIFRASEIDGISIAEVYLAFLLLMPISFAGKYLFLLFLINIVFILISEKRNPEFLKKIMQYIAAIMPVFISSGNSYGYIFSVYLLLLIIIAPKSFIISRKALKIYVWFLTRIRLLSSYKPSLNFTIRIFRKREMSLSFAIALIFIILIVISTL